MDKIKERWGAYFDHLLKEENLRTVFGDGVLNEGLTPEISRKDVEAALKKMKNGKATGTDNILAEVWKCLGEDGIDMLLNLINKIYREEKMRWMLNTIVNLLVW